MRWGAISGAVSVDGGLEPSRSAERWKGRICLSLVPMSYQEVTHCPGLQHLHPPHLLLQLPLGNQWWPELVALLADFLPVDYLHEHQVPGFSWPKNPGTKGLKGQ